MTPQNPPQAPAEPRARGNTTRAHESPQRATCTIPGCERITQRHGLCESHARTNPHRGHTLALPGALPIRPHRTKAQRDALHALAESNPTPTEYERKKQQILKGETP